MIGEQQLKANDVDKAWLGFLFKANAGGFEYFGKDLDGKVFSHPESGRVSFAGDWVQRYHYFGLSRVVDKSFYNSGFNSWQYLAFKSGFDKGRRHSILHPHERRFYDLGREANTRFHQI